MKFLSASYGAAKIIKRLFLKIGPKRLADYRQEGCVFTSFKSGLMNVKKTFYNDFWILGILDFGDTILNSLQFFALNFRSNSIAAGEDWKAHDIPLS